MPAPESNRSSLIDALRGIAVIGMIVAHGIFFFHDSTQPLLNATQGYLNLTIFTLFLFVSGLSTSKWIEKLDTLTTVQRIKSITFKIGSLYLGYAMIAIVTNINSLQKIISSLLLLEPPNFTEYFLLFIGITTILLVFFPLFKKTKSSLLLTIIVSCVCYLLGFLLYPLVLPSFLNNLKAIFAGGQNLLRFPILFYLPVFLLGLWWEKSKPLIFFFSSIIFFALLFVSDVWIRWPPSLGNLSLGLFIATTLYVVVPVLQIKIVSPVYQLLTILGRHSMDLWILHLLILLGYQRFSGKQFADVFPVCLAIFFLFSLTIALSTLTVRQQPSFINVGPFGVSQYRRKKFQMRYLFFVILIPLLLIVIYNRKETNSIYGDVMPTPHVFPSSKQYESIKKAALSSKRTWHIRMGTRSDLIHTNITFTDDKDSVVNVDKSDISLFLDGKLFTNDLSSYDSEASEFLLSSSDIEPGVHTLTASLNTGETTVVSNSVTINITEPFQIAWTLDWEGWDVSDKTLQQINLYSGTYKLPFTHFISPRTFLDGVLTQKRKQELIAYLLDREKSGDELAMHLHMHFDLIKAAGLIPKTTRPWGLLSNEGYDVPTTEYSSEDFRTIIQFAKKIARDAGLPDFLGYRAGGWFINSELLTVLEQEGFSYDSSGREKPLNGAFRTTPWNLEIDTSPYYPAFANQNTSTTSRKIMEIPNTGGSTYDLSIEEMTARIQTVYKGGILETPKTLVFVSHPQFANREFSKVPEILTFLQQHSYANDKGPILFVTTSEIHGLWEQLLQ